jgi:hypothetical protein
MGIDCDVAIGAIGGFCVGEGGRGIEYGVGVRGGVAKNWLGSFSEAEVSGEGNSEGVKRGDRKGISVLCVA